LAILLTALLNGWRALHAIWRGIMSESGNPHIVDAFGRPMPEKQDARLR
jgi:hypothetical protein